MSQAHASAPDGTASELDGEIARFRRHLRAADLSPRTQRSYLGALAQFTRTCSATPTPTARSCAGCRRRTP